jgi:heme/copper-type cytochrome/quinol oxidase subunit 3
MVKFLIYKTSRCGTAEIELPERSERGTLPAVATTVLLGFFFFGLAGFDEP